MKKYKKTEHFEAIAMKCNQEQFNELKPILEEFDCKIEQMSDNFNSYPTLVNNNFRKKNHITNHCCKNFEKRTCHEIFNAETFLKACGIVEVGKTPSLEEVKQKFKNAKEVRGIYSNFDYEIDTEKYGLYFEKNDIRQNKNNKDEQILLYCSHQNKYAEIISYKEKTYQLSETFVKELCKEPNIKEAFVREGIIESDKLEVGKWYRRKGCNSIVFYQGFNIKTYGFYDNGYELYFENHNKWAFDKYYTDIWTLATPQEVETALINEAKKRGYVYGISIVDIYNGTSKKYLTIVSSNEFFYETIKAGENQGQMALRDADGNVIFHNGTWAEIIKPETYVKIPQSLIDNTPNDLELGGLVRNFKE